MTSTDVAIPQEEIIGLEDFDPMTDGVIPRLKIGHNEDAGYWIDNLSKERFTALDGVVLGLVKGRVLWKPTMGAEAEDPLCKSYDHKVGHPDPKDKNRFPWNASGFQYADFATVDAPALRCEDCVLKNWGTNPANPKQPWCTEQFNFIVMLPNGRGGWVPYILTLQKTAITPAKQYANSFAQKGTPMFIVGTSFSLEVRKTGQVNYGVPEFKRGNPTDPADHKLFADTYRSIRAYLQSPRSGEEDDDGLDVTPPSPTENINVQAPVQVADPIPAPQPAPAPQPTQPVPAASAEPSPQPAPTPAPVASVAPAPAPVAQPAQPVMPQVVETQAVEVPAPAPVAVAAPAEVPAMVPTPVPAAAPVAAAPAVEATVAEATAVAQLGQQLGAVPVQDDGGDLPF